MSKEVTVEELAANLREHLAEVQQGETLTIVADGKAIATMQPYGEVSIIRHNPAFRLGDFNFGPRPKNLKTDPAALIIEERERERSGEKYRS